MDPDQHIPPQYINGLIKEIADSNTTIGLKFKKKYKEAIYLFVHYLLTYAEEIAKEKDVMKINNQIINEALLEIDFGDIIETVAKLQLEAKESKEVHKRGHDNIDA